MIAAISAALGSLRPYDAGVSVNGTAVLLETRPDTLSFPCSASNTARDRTYFAVDV